MLEDKRTTYAWGFCDEPIQENLFNTLDECVDAAETWCKKHHIKDKIVFVYEEYPVEPLIDIDFAIEDACDDLNEQCGDEQTFDWIETVGHLDTNPLQEQVDIAFDNWLKANGMEHNFYTYKRIVILDV